MLIIYYDESVPAACSAAKKMKHGEQYTALTHEEFVAVANGSVRLLGASTSAESTQVGNMFEPLTIGAGMTLAG